jgi:acetylglutamate kinase
MIYFPNHSFYIAALTLLSDVAGIMDGYAQAGTSIQNVKATYAVEIVPEAQVSSRAR